MPHAVGSARMDFDVDKRSVFATPGSTLAQAKAFFRAVTVMVMFAAVAFPGVGVTVDRKTPGDAGVEFECLRAARRHREVPVITVQMQCHGLPGRKPDNDPVTLVNPDRKAVSVTVAKIQVERPSFTCVRRAGHTAQQSKQAQGRNGQVPPGYPAAWRRYTRMVDRTHQSPPVCGKYTVPGWWAATVSGPCRRGASRIC